MGTIIGIEENQNEKVCGVIVKFDNPSAGREARKRNPMMSIRYPEGTLITKTEQDYSLGRSKEFISSTAKLIQFPLVLAWAVTVHKFQGQTVTNPQKVVLDLKSVFEAAQAYVMLSRVQELEQVYILKELPENKIYANMLAKSEIERLLTVSLNRNPRKWDDKDPSRLRICFLNCRSIKNKVDNIKADMNLLKSDILILTETWLQEDQESVDYQIEGYHMKLNNIGRGRGIACYFNNKFTHSKDINSEGFSISKITSSQIDVIGVYKSIEGDWKDLVSKINELIDGNRFTIIGGDLNVCCSKLPNNHLTNKLKEMKFQQIVTQATHIEGGSLDHIYMKQIEEAEYDWELEYFPKYFSDHDALGLTLWKTTIKEIESVKEQ